MSYLNFNSMWIGALRDIQWCGHDLDSRAGKTKELLAYAKSLNDITRSTLTIPARKFSLEYACAELLWYLNESDSGSIILAYAPKNYGQFLTDEGRAKGHYGQRWWDDESFRKRNQLREKSQLDYVMGTLKKQPNSRQCVLSMWQGGDIVDGFDGTSKDIPCTLNLQFLLREGYLSCITTMRSNDVWLGMPYDVYCFTAIQKIVADYVGARYGMYYHRVGSMHAYERNYDGINRVLDTVTSSDSSAPSCSIVSLASRRYREDLAIALELEEAARVWQSVAKIENLIDKLQKVHYVLHDAALVCANKWFPEMKLLDLCIQESHRVDPRRT